MIDKPYKWLLVDQLKSAGLTKITASDLFFSTSNSECYAIEFRHVTYHVYRLELGVGFNITKLKDIYLAYSRREAESYIRNLK